MTTLRTYKSAFYQTIGLIALRKISLSSIVGSKLSFFALDQAVAPLGGFFASSVTAFMVYFVRTGLHFIFAAKSAVWLLHLPTLAGALILSSQSRIVKMGIPLLCSALFLAHPVGFESSAYTLYWIAPLIIGIMNLQIPLLRALAATLTTHAVGSTLWIYTHQTNALFWHSLLPIVWYERLAFALCLTAGYYVVEGLRDYRINVAHAFKFSKLFLLDNALSITSKEPQ